MDSLLDIFKDGESASAADLLELAGGALSGGGHPLIDAIEPYLNEKRKEKLGMVKTAIKFAPMILKK